MGKKWQQAQTGKWGGKMANRHKLANEAKGSKEWGKWAEMGTTDKKGQKVARVNMAGNGQ